VFNVIGVRFCISRVAHQREEREGGERDSTSEGTGAKAVRNNGGVAFFLVSRRGEIPTNLRPFGRLRQV